MIQEMMARRLNAKIGEYFQFVGSMHIYQKHLDLVNEYVSEGVQQTIEMPPMPAGDPFGLIPDMIRVENRLRIGETFDAAEAVSDPYWADIVRLLQVFWARELSEDYSRRLSELRDQLASPTYRPYIDGRMHLKGRARSQ